jgi:colanic acid biosynthesis glycosyl transferase WcaI
LIDTEILSSDKKILLISHNYSPEPTGIGKYNGEMIDWLAKKGYNCTVITTYPYYPYWKVQAPYKNRWYKKEVVKYALSNATVAIYRCPSYVPANPTGKRRILQDFSFWTSMFWTTIGRVISKKKFDLIVTVAPPFHLAYLGLMLRKLNGGKLLYHVQDLQIEAAQELNMLSNQKLFDRIYKIEKNIMTKADYVSSISDGMINKIKSKAEKDVYFFPNWVDTSYFFPLDNKAALKNEWGYDADDVVFLYSGAVGEKQGLENILTAAESLIGKTFIKFIICGTGPYKEKLIRVAGEKKLSNVKFLPVQDKALFNEFLNIADVHLILQKSNASDLVMPSKLTTILAVGGVSLVTAPKGTSLYKIIDQFNLGYVIEPENEQLLTDTILKIIADQKFVEKRDNARKYALKYLNIDNIMNNFVNNFLNS